MRVKRGNVARKRRKKILQRAKGFRGGLSKLFRTANAAVIHAQNRSYIDRRRKKRDFRRLWVSRISGALTETSLSYSTFMGGLAKKNVQLNRKMLSELAISSPESFQKIVAFVQK